MLTAALSSFAQEFGLHWVSIPIPDSTSHVWFRQVYLSPARHRQAHITISTTGYFKLYVNESNVGTAPYYPYRKPSSNDIVTMNFDVSRYLRNDTNVIAIMYAPSFPHINRKQVSLTFYGRDANGIPFAYHSDENWLCRQANSSMKTNGGEYIDGRKHNVSWKTTDCHQALWVGVTSQTDSLAAPVTTYYGCYPAERIARRREAAYFDLTKDGVEYDFRQGFYGRIRLTLREARKGQVIRFGNNDYVCSGELDEQAYPIFSSGHYRRIPVSGDSGFRQDQIVGIEAVETAPITIIDYKD